MEIDKTHKNNKDFTDQEITLKLLDSIDKEINITQKEAARNIGVAVGLVNSYVKRCIKKGWLKVKNIPAHRYAYYLTPKGFAKKSQLVGQYLSDSLKLYRESKLSYEKIFIECKKKKYSKIYLAGTSDLTEIAILVSKATNLEISGIISKNKINNNFLYKKYNFSNLPRNIDAIVITEILEANKYYNILRKKLHGTKIFTPKLLRISKKV